ncbi:hypothetical protein [Aureimonas ureilytica]|uniref:hypothetical protein n=1 Tax=Aureimonas ureilytica TaxID=401562 RepID=UPI000735045F|nr:hypothetical protein [Aureimonas ureilytica]
MEADTDHRRAVDVVHAKAPSCCQPWYESRSLGTDIASGTRESDALVAADEDRQRLLVIPGVGPLDVTALVAAVVVGVEFEGAVISLPGLALFHASIPKAFRRICPACPSAATAICGVCLFTKGGMRERQKTGSVRDSIRSRRAHETLVRADDESNRPS